MENKNEHIIGTGDSNSLYDFVREQLLEVDTHDLSSLESIKSFVANAKQASRSAYIASLKDAVENGTYNPSTNSIVSAMFADGTVEALL